MSDLIERVLETALTDAFLFGQILIRRSDQGFVLLHRSDERREDLHVLRGAESAIDIARNDDAGNYRPLKTAPNLRHGWRLELSTIGELKHGLDYFYPGRLSVFVAWKTDQLRTTPLRDTLDRQSGMYRLAAKISDEQINDLIGDFCRSDGGCLRTILWKRDQRGTTPSTRLPPQKFGPAYDQAAQGPRLATAATTATPATGTIPLLCQEACNLLVAECRNVVKGESAASDATPNAFGAGTAEK
jgi:sirohydrochlorin cobaltochelatase